MYGPGTSVEPSTGPSVRAVTRAQCFAEEVAPAARNLIDVECRLATAYGDVHRPGQDLYDDDVREEVEEVVVVGVLVLLINNTIYNINPYGSAYQPYRMRVPAVQAQGTASHRTLVTSSCSAAAVQPRADGRFRYFHQKIVIAGTIVPAAVCMS